METNHSQIVSLIWNIADDVLRDVFLRGQYRTLEENERDIRELDAQSQGFIQSLFENL